jgi:predicted MFS family arabinose efflux permease
MAAAAAVVGANVHYAQPLLPVMADEFGVGTGVLGALPALTQAGFILGLLLVVPLGDVVERRRLVVATVAAVSLALGATALAPTVPVLLVSGFAVGLLTIAPQLLVPFAAALAPEGAQGRASGLVLSGVLFGVLLSKVIAGFVTAAVGWRVLYAGAAVLMLVTAGLLWKLLPRSVPATSRPGYAALLRSLAGVAARPALRVRIVSGALTGAAFMVFWTTYAAHLDETLGLGPVAAGAVAVVGLGGALASPWGGRASDAGRMRTALTSGSLLMLVAPLVLWWGQTSIVAIVVGAVLLDAGTGLSHSANQAGAMATDPGSRGRINSVYVSGYFLGAALGTGVANTVFAAWGWGAVCALGVVVALAAVAVAQVGRTPKLQLEVRSS